MLDPNLILTAIGLALTILIPTVGWANSRLKSVKLKIVSAYAYVKRYSNYDLEDYSKNTYYQNSTPSWKIGDVKGVSTIIELEVLNETNQPVTVTSIIIDDWIFADKRISESIEAYNRDYRSFDLHSRELVDLRNRTRIESNSSIGYRIEIRVDVFSDGRVFTKYPTFLPIDAVYTHKISITLSTGKVIKKKIKVDLIDDMYSTVPFWSDLSGGGGIQREIPEEIRKMRKKEYEDHQKKFRRRQMSLRAREFFNKFTRRKP